MLEINEKRDKHIRDKKFELADESLNLAENTNNLILALEDAKSNRIIANIEREAAALDARYAKESAAAGTNAFKKQMVDQKHAQKKLELEKKIEAEKDKQAKRDKQRGIFAATISLGQAVLGTMKDTPGTPIERILAGVIIASAGAAWIASIADASYRSGGVVDGEGNATSDSVWARVSKGERVLSVDEVSRMGGNERVQTLIDRGGNMTNNRNVVIHVDNFIGSRTFVKELKEELMEELAR
jgi:hypothetical protein